MERHYSPGRTWESMARGARRAALARRRARRRRGRRHDRAAARAARRNVLRASTRARRSWTRPGHASRSVGTGRVSSPATCTRCRSRRVVRSGAALQRADVARRSRRGRRRGRARAAARRDARARHARRARRTRVTAATATSTPGFAPQTLPALLESAGLDGSHMRGHVARAARRPTSQVVTAFADKDSRQGSKVASPR